MISIRVSMRPPGVMTVRGGRDEAWAARSHRSAHRHTKRGEGTADWDTATSNRSTCLDLLDMELFVHFQ